MMKAFTGYFLITSVPQVGFSWRPTKEDLDPGEGVSEFLGISEKGIVRGSVCCPEFVLVLVFGLVMSHSQSYLQYSELANYS